MTPLQEKLLENKVRKIYKKIINEAVQLDANEVKAILQYVNGLGGLVNLNYSTNDKTIHGFQNKISETRMQLMSYVEENSQYKFTPNGSNKWKLTTNK
jgi:hypothetical protein